MERTIEGIPLSEVQRVLRTYFAPSQVRMAIGVSAPPEVLQQQFGYGHVTKAFMGDNTPGECLSMPANAGYQGGVIGFWGVSLGATDAAFAGLNKGQ
jgi:hypothetical protein